jgi:hypothetical protein
VRVDITDELMLIVRGVGKARAHSGDPASENFLDLLHLWLSIENAIGSRKSDMRDKATISLIGCHFIVYDFLLLFGKVFPIRF